MLPGAWNLVPIDPNTTEAIFLATGGPERMGTVTHIGGGLFLGHNHGRVASDTDHKKELFFGAGSLSEQKVTVNASYHFTEEDHLNGASGGGLDIMLYTANVPNNAIPGIPLLIMSDLSDLVGETTITTRWTTPYTNSPGMIHYSTGIVSSTSGEAIGITNALVGGMSGAGIFIHKDADRDGFSESYIIGTVSDTNSGTSLSGRAYHDLANTLVALNYDLDLLPRFTLMSGQRESSISHIVHGAVFNENLIGGDWNDTLIGNKGDDIIWGGGGSDTFVFSSGDGHDIIRDFSILQDEIVVDGVAIPHFVITDTHLGALVTYDNGSASIMFENLAADQVTEVFVSYNIIYRQISDGEVHLGTTGRDLIYGHSGNNWFEASDHDGADFFVGGAGRNTLSYKTATQGVTIDLEERKGLAGTAAGDQWMNINVVQTSFHDDIIYGSSNSDIIWTHGGNDYSYGGHGNDILRKSLGTDIFDGGEGYDTVTYNSGGGFEIYLYSPQDDRYEPGMDTYISVEKLIASNRNDTITVGPDTDFERIEMANGDDVINILCDHLQVAGGGGSDTFNILPDDLFAVTVEIEILDFNKKQDALNILGDNVDFSLQNLAPQGFVYGEDSTGNLTIFFGDDDMIVLTGVNSIL